MLLRVSRRSPSSMGNVEQDARAQRLAVGIGRVEQPVVHGSAQAQAEEDAVRHLDLPAGIDVGLAGEPLGVDGGADGGPDGAAEHGPAGAEQQLGIDVDAAFEVEARSTAPAHRGPARRRGTPGRGNRRPRLGRRRIGDQAKPSTITSAAAAALTGTNPLAVRDWRVPGNYARRGGAQYPIRTLPPKRGQRRRGTHAALFGRRGKSAIRPRKQPVDTAVSTLKAQRPPLSLAAPCASRRAALESKGVLWGALVVSGGTAMEATTALLEHVTRVLAAGFSAAPLVWVLALLGCLRLLASWRCGDISVAAMSRRVFLASAAATRKAREISEIDAFVRRAGAAAEELKSQLRRLRAGHHSQVKIYIDHSNFITTWNGAVHNRDRPLEHDVDWHALPQVLLEEIGDWLTKVRKAPQALLYRGMHVYGTLFEDELLQAARDHAAVRADGAQQALPADPPAQGDDRAVAGGERGPQDRADAGDPQRDGLRDGADLPPYAARGPAVELPVYRRAAYRSRPRRSSIPTSPRTSSAMPRSTPTTSRSS